MSYVHSVEFLLEIAKGSGPDTKAVCSVCGWAAAKIKRLREEHADLVMLVRCAGNRLRDYDEHDEFCRRTHDYLESIGIKPKIIPEVVKLPGKDGEA